MSIPWVTLDIDEPIWDRFFTVAPLVLIGTVEPDGGYDLAPIQDFQTPETIPRILAVQLVKINTI